MKTIITQFNEQLNQLIREAELNIIKKLSNFKNEEILNNYSKIFKIEKIEDTNKLIYGSGFYIIFSDYLIEKNPSEISYLNTKPIYRGHGSRTKQRVISHLFKELYDLDKKRTNYTVCLKIEPGINGININKEPYNKYEWYVLNIPLLNSNKLLREVFEKSFDNTFIKPIFSRD